jgi:transketolase
MSDFDAMKIQCNDLRKRIVEIIHHAGSGHSGGSLSAVEILWTLYSRVLNVRPQEPNWPDRDRFILSKGHAAPCLYTVLAECGFFPQEELVTLRQAGSRLQGHPDMRKLPGVDMSAGSLGMGISAGIGMALAGKLSASGYHVYVLVGDGELQEGQNWEAFLAAHKFALDNLTVIVDRNGVQLDGRTEDIMPMGDLAEKIAVFGWQVSVCDGHDCASILTSVEQARKVTSRPTAIVANTIKGKGVSFMEGQSAWHGAPISIEHYETAQRDLEAQS